MVNVEYADGKQAVRELWGLKAGGGAKEIQAAVDKL